MARHQERRRFHRFPFEADCELDLGAAGQQDCELLDLSLNGALIRLSATSDARLEARQLVEHGSLRLRLTGAVRGDQASMDMMVRAIRVQGDTLACRFVAVDAESMAVLKTLVAANLGNAELLERELTQLDYWPGLSISPSA